MSLREQKCREWEQNQRDQAKNHDFIGHAVIEEANFNKSFKFTADGEGAGDQLRGLIESVSGLSFPSNHRALTRGASGTSLHSLTSGTPGTDDDHDFKHCLTYGSNASLSSVSSGLGSKIF